MTQIPNLNSTSSSDQAFGSANTLNDLNLDDFLNLMIAELQNQDPLNPMENDELIAQISQIREVGATDRLTSTLDAVLLGQNIASATNLIGAEIEAISDDNQRVHGIVDRISISNGQPKLHLDEDPVVLPSDEPGNVGQGAYEYRIVWEDAEGNLFGVETHVPVQLGEEETSVMISNLPLTSGSKQIYRKTGDASQPYKLVDVLPDGSTSSYLDTKSNEELSSKVLNRTPQLVTESSRSFTVSLNNVGEIRPPSSR